MQNCACGQNLCPENVELDPKLARKEAVNDMKRSLILDAAQRVMVRDGYANARIEDIAEEAGFSRAAIYHYFPDKEAIFIHMAIKEQQAMYEKYVEIAARNLSFLDTVEAFALAFYDRFFGNNSMYSMSSAAVSPAFVMLNLISSMSKHEELLNISITLKKETYNVMIQVVARARENGTLNIPVSDDSVVIMISTFLHACMMNSISSEWRTSEENRKCINDAIEALFVFLSPWVKGKD